MRSTFVSTCVKHTYNNMWPMLTFISRPRCYSTKEKGWILNVCCLQMKTLISMGMAPLLWLIPCACVFVFAVPDSFWLIISPDWLTQLQQLQMRRPFRSYYLLSHYCTWCACLGLTIKVNGRGAEEFWRPSCKIFLADVEIIIFPVNIMDKNILFISHHYEGRCCLFLILDLWT